MKLPTMPFTVAKLTQASPVREAGTEGESLSRMATFGDLRVRLVEYQPGYLADHWCDRGHVFYLVKGEIDVELQDGRTFPLKAGESFQVSDHGDAAHRVRTQGGGTAFIVD